MKTIKEIKENPKLEILQTSIDGISGILHMTGLRHCTVVASWGGGWEHVWFARPIGYQIGQRCVISRICSGTMMKSLCSFIRQRAIM